MRLCIPPETVADDRRGTRWRLDSACPSLCRANLAIPPAESLGARRVVMHRPDGRFFPPRHRARGWPMTQPFSPYGRNLFGEVIEHRRMPGILRQRFMWPPFSVLDTRGGEWRDRGNAWRALGIKSEVGRDDALVYDRISPGKYDGLTSRADSGTSIFDPALCETAYRWFTPPGGQVVDPFAGGSVRGVVAAALGFSYWGCDLREEQVAANREQLAAIEQLPGGVAWHTGDALDLVPQAPEADFVFSCPPYGDLEQYSDHPRDLSNMEWETFRAAYGRIILRCVERLRDNRFAAFVVGNFRDKHGRMRDFRGETVQAFEAAGAHFYNEMVLVSPVGSARLRATKQFNTSRKLVMLHQVALVFCKGDPRVAAAAIRTPGEGECEGEDAA